MDNLRAKALVARLVERMANHGSWCGETHIQKTVYFFQQVFNPEMGFEFILYKHGPFSFELRDTIAEMKADGLLDVHIKPYPYGPSIYPGPLAQDLIHRYPKTINRWDDSLEQLATRISPRSVAELERLATALYIMETEGTAQGGPRRLHELKPHVPILEAQEAFEEVLRLRKEVAAIGTE